MKLPLSLLAVACVLSAAASLRADQLVNYDFTTDANTTSVDAALVASSTAFVYSGSSSGGGRSSASGGNVYARLNDLTASLGSPVSARNFSFILTPKDGEPLDLGLLTFNYGYQNIGTGAHPAYTLYYQVGVTVAGGSEVIIPTVFSYDVDAAPSGNNKLDGSASLDLSSYSQLQGVTSSITFSFYIYAQVTGGAASVNETARIDNVSLATAAAIPEPASVAMVAGGVAGLLVLVRRRGRR